MDTQTPANLTTTHETASIAMQTAQRAGPMVKLSTLFPAQSSPLCLQMYSYSTQAQGTNYRFTY